MPQGTSRVVQHALPNVVHREGSSGFTEEIHVIPIAPGRSRVLLRQTFPDIPFLRRVLRVPGFPSFLRWLVENWNYHIALEDYPPDSASQSATADLGGSLRSRTGLADDLIAQFNAWRARTLESEGPTYFVRWDGKRDGAVSSFGCTSRFGMQREDGSEGTHGIKRSYLQSTPAAEFAPMNAGQYNQFIQVWQALRGTAIGGILTVPAVLATYQTIAPAVAELGSKTGTL
ncbi:MAG: hypothetical protein SGPRY_013393 [Prymnesium sp.]